MARADPPFFTPLPVWGLPGLLTGMQPTKEFQEHKAHVFYWFPPHIKDVLGIEDGMLAEIPFPEFRIDHHKFARAIAKIAYCEAVIFYGLHGFRKLVLPDLILGRYPCVPYFVGCEMIEPPPPAAGSTQHVTQIITRTMGNLRLIIVRIRLYANSGIENHGPPFYEVVVGALPSTQGLETSPAFRKHGPNTKPVVIALPAF
jgi:hypothetical protein